MRTHFDEIPVDLQDLIPDYLYRRKEDVKQLKDLIEKRNYDEIRQLGHRLKGSGASYGFPYLTELGRKIESASVGEDSEELKVILKNFTEEIEEALTFLQQKSLQH
jgi:HPt (histidine-containing phosphotransfer) domain-containing protein